jgi:hypothetical protein
VPPDPERGEREPSSLELRLEPHPTENITIAASGGSKIRHRVTNGSTKG